MVCGRTSLIIKNIKRNHLTIRQLANTGLLQRLYASFLIPLVKTIITKSRLQPIRIVFINLNTKDDSANIRKTQYAKFSTEITKN